MFANVVLRKLIIIREVADIAVCRGEIWFIERSTLYILYFDIFLPSLVAMHKNSNFKLQYLRKKYDFLTTNLN